MFASPDQSLNLLAEFIDLSAQPMTIADFGCGSGYYTLKVATRMHPDSRLYAVDIQKSLLERLQNEAAAKGLHNVYTVWSDLENVGATKIPEASVNVGIIANILFQVDDKEAFITEVKRLLANHSYLLLVDWVDSFSNMGPTTDSVFGPDTAKDLLTDHGFNIQVTHQHSDHHYAIVASVN